MIIPTLLLGAGVGLVALLVAEKSKKKKPAAKPRPKRRRKKKKPAAKPRPKRRKKKKKKKKPTAAPDQRAPQVKAADEAADDIKAHKVEVEDKGEPSLAPRVAAQQYFDYVTKKIKAGKAAQLGDKGNRNKKIKAWQRDMKRVRVDGIYGPDDRARGKELLGRSWPRRVRRALSILKNPGLAPGVWEAMTRAQQKAAIANWQEGPVAPREAGTPPPETLTKDAEEAAAEPPPEEDEPPPENDEPSEALARAPQKAATDLYGFAETVLAAGEGWKLGVKGNPSNTVKLAQRDMGRPDWYTSEVWADGFYGPSTKKRGKELTGLTFPVRA